MSTIITRPAVRIQQGSKTLFTTSFTVADFEHDNFYRVDRLDPEEEGGYQRLLQEARAKRLKSYAIEAWKEGKQTFLPTSVFLATDKSIDFDEQRNMLSFDEDIVCPFDVVDGQHRIRGLQLAAQEEPELKRFPIIANIAINTSEVEQMLHFYVVNTTQKAVDEGVGNHIRRRFFRMLETHKLPYIPSWIDREVRTGKDDEAISIIQHLNSDKKSPWYGKIQGSHEPKRSDATVNEKAFASALKRTVSHASHPLKMFGESKRNDIFMHYWCAIERVFTNPDTHDNTIVFKTTGVEFFCRLSSAIIARAHWDRSYDIESFEKIFRDLSDHVPSDSQAMFYPDWWKSGGEASGWNRSAIDKRAVEFSQSVNALTESEREDRS